jgi:hypothetical protein
VKRRANSFWPMPCWLHLHYIWPRGKPGKPGKQATVKKLAGLWGKPACVGLGLRITDRRGAGSMLVKWGTDQADERGIPCYLESSPEGFGLYNKHGFKEVVSARTGQPITRLTRHQHQTTSARSSTPNTKRSFVSDRFQGNGCWISEEFRSI